MSETKKLQEEHIHMTENGQETSLLIIKVDGHMHTVGGLDTSTSQNTETHTHTLPDGSDTSPPIESSELSIDKENKLSRHRKEDKLKMSFNIQSIKLQEGEAIWIDVMRTVNGDVHGLFGNINITKNDLLAYKKNFDLGIPKKELPIDFFHESSKDAAGWLKQLRIADAGNTLQGFVEFTQTAREKIKEGAIKFFSPEFSESSKNKKGEVIKNVLFGGGLTNRPFLDMREIDASSIKLSENFQIQIPIQGVNNMALEELKEKEKIMSEMITSNQEASKKLQELYDGNIKKLSDQVSMLTKLVDEANKEKESQSFEASFLKLLDEGKVTPAMKEKCVKQFSADTLIDFYKDSPVILSTSATGTESANPIKKLTVKDESLKLAEKMIVDGELSKEDHEESQEIERKLKFG